MFLTWAREGKQCKSLAFLRDEAARFQEAQVPLSTTRQRDSCYSKNTNGQKLAALPWTTRTAWLLLPRRAQSSLNKFSTQAAKYSTDEVGRWASLTGDVHGLLKCSPPERVMIWLSYNCCSVAQKSEIRAGNDFKDQRDHTLKCFLVSYFTQKEIYGPYICRFLNIITKQIGSQLPLGFSNRQAVGNHYPGYECKHPQTILYLHLLLSPVWMTATWYVVFFDLLHLLILFLRSISVIACDSGSFDYSIIFHGMTIIS